MLRHILEHLHANKELFVKSSVTILSASLSHLEMFNMWIRTGSAFVALIVGILTIFKLIKDLRK